jgi:AraC-like DNA-binding protein
VPRLERRRVFGSGKADETESFLERIGFDFEPAAGTQRSVDTRLNGVYLTGMYFGYSQYGAPATVRPTSLRTDHWIQIPLAGGVEVSSRADVVACDSRKAAVVSPKGEHVMRMSAGSGRIQVSLTGPALQNQLAALLGEAPRAPLVLAPQIELAGGYGRRLASYLALAVESFEADEAMPWSAIEGTQFEQLFMTTLLLFHPHTHSEVLHRRSPSVTPRDVKRAADYINAHLDEPMTLGDIATAAGVPGRTLIQHFRDFTGVPPMRYLRLQRYRAARDALAKARPGDSITTIAGRFGFSHLGRFAVEYRKRFGERPRETLARALGGTAPPEFVAAAEPAPRPTRLNPNYSRFS